MSEKNRDKCPICGAGVAEIFSANEDYEYIKEENSKGRVVAGSFGSPDKIRRLVSCPNCGEFIISHTFIEDVLKNSQVFDSAICRKKLKLFMHENKDNGPYCLLITRLYAKEPETIKHNNKDYKVLHIVDLEK
jgi:ribosomal protein S27AE